MYENLKLCRICLELYLYTYESSMKIAPRAMADKSGLLAGIDIPTRWKPYTRKPKQ